MTIGADYVSLPEFKDYIKISGSAKEAALQMAVTSASRNIERFCNRQFNKEDVATPRRFRPDLSTLAEVDDFYEATGLVIETGTDGTFTDTWSASDYELDPADGIREGQPGWPFSVIRAFGRTFPMDGRQSLRVTAKWGWPTVPQPVKQACLELAHEIYKSADAPFGVAGFDQYGAVRVRENSKVCAMLSRYRRLDM